MNKSYSYVLVLFATLLMTSCGSESSNGVQNEIVNNNTAPSIKLNNKTIYNNEDLELFAQVEDDGSIKKYEWRDSKNNVIGDSSILFIKSPHKLGKYVYTLNVIDNKGLSTKKSTEVIVEDSKYAIKNNNIPVYVANKSFDDYKLKQITDDSFNNLSEASKYRVAEKLLSSMFFAYTHTELKSKINSGTFISDIKNQLLVSSNSMDDIEETIHDSNRYYQNEYRADALILSRFFEMSKLDKHFYNHWVSYILTQTILFSPAAELNTVAESDIYGIYNRLYQLQESEVGMRYSTYLHMQSTENWRRFRSPEDNGREMLEIYALDEDDTHVPLVAQALKNWYLSKQSNTLVVGLNKNTKLLTLSDDIKFKSGIEFYAALSSSKAFTKGITTRLVDFMFLNITDDKRKNIINKIVNSKPETWSDILKQILFSEEYLLHMTRVKSIEENTFSLMKKLSYNSYFYTFEKLRDNMLIMGQASMRYKLGKLVRVPLDNIAFATYQKSLRDSIFRTWSRDTELSYNPKRVDDTHNSDYFMQTYKSGYRRGISSKNFMSNNNFEIGDNTIQTQTNYINYIFNTVLNRNAYSDEIDMFQEHLNGDSPQWFSAYFNKNESSYEKFLQYQGKYNLQYIVFEYISRLDELYFYKEVK